MAFTLATAHDQAEATAPLATPAASRAFRTRAARPPLMASKCGRGLGGWGCWAGAGGAWAARAARNRSALPNTSLMVDSTLSRTTWPTTSLTASATESLSAAARPSKIVSRRSSWADSCFRCVCPLLLVAFDMMFSLKEWPRDPGGTRSRLIVARSWVEKGDLFVAGARPAFFREDEPLHRLP